jgi:hypothetical protein
MSSEDKRVDRVVRLIKEASGSAEEKVAPGGNVVKVKGNGDIVNSEIVGGDVHTTIIYTDEPEPDCRNPRLVACPVCSRAVSRTTTGCPRCGHNVREHFYAIYRKLRNAQLQKSLLWSVIGFFAFGFASRITWLPSEISIVLAAVALGSLLMAYMVASLLK